MLIKKRLLKKVASQIAMGLVFLIFFSLVYFFSRAYFEEYLLANYKANSFSINNVNQSVASVPIENDTFVATTSVIIKKINNEIVDFYNFFFDLPAASSVSANLKSGESAGTTYLGSFAYTSANVDPSKTNLRFDSVTNGISFVPNYTWENASPDLISANKNKFDNYQENIFSGPGNDKRCLGNNCLEVRNNKLFYNNNFLALPFGLKSADLQAISLGTVASRWLVGLTIKDNGYRGEVFYFDGVKFSKLTNFNPVVSKYFGLFGFGGEDNDFLIIYGAYQGQAFRVQGDNITNLDKFFSYRPMSNGFKAEIIKAKNGSTANWYVYSATTNNPKLIKLWQDDSGAIIGAISLASDLKITGESAQFNLVAAQANSLTLLAKIKNNNQESWKVFKDYGFITDQEKVLVTLPVAHDALNSKIIINNIYESQLGVDSQGKSLVKIQFSIDGLNWQDLPLGKDLNFPQAATKDYFLKLNFAPTTNHFYSPFVSNIIFSYTCHI